MITNKGLKPIVIGGILGLLFLGGVVLFTSPTLPPIDRSIPKHEEINVLTDKSLYVHFAEPVEPNHQTRIKVAFDPPVETNINWHSDRQSVEIDPLQELVKKTSYTVSFELSGKTFHTLRFTTNPYNVADLREQARIQIQDDFLYAGKFQEEISQYPWYHELPVITPTHTIFFDFQEKKFIITIIDNAARENALSSAVLRISEFLDRPSTTLDYYVVDAE